MRIMTNPKKVVASATISELQSSDVYLTLKARLFDLRANLNGVRVTQAFLDEIIENEAKYVCHPLYADIRGLVANKKIGHMYNSRTGEFHTTQIGAFYHFEKEEEDDNAYLVGYARVPKRNKAVCKALSDLFTDNALKFSFEVNCCTYDVDEDGTMIIDAAEGNYWEGECVVTFPACKDAIAQELIAECLGKGDEIMADENKMNTESEAKETAEATQTAETTNEAASTQTAETTNEAASTQTAETIFVTQEHTEIDNVYAYNCETDESVSQRVVVETTTRTPVEIAEDRKDEEGSCEDKKDEGEDAPDEKKVAEEEPDEKEDEDEEESCGKQVAENGNWAVLIAEMRDSIDALRKEIAQMRESHETPTAVIAEAEQPEEEKEETIIAQSAEDDGATTVNPFMASISAPKKYTLLDREEKPARKYSLLERA